MSIAELNDREWEPTGWDLSQLLPDADQATIDARLTALGAAVDAFSAKRDGLESIDASGVLEMVREFESLVESMHVLGAYASLWFASDTQCEEALAFRNRVEHELTALHNRTLFFTLWWKGLEDAEASALEPDAGEHPDQAFFLRDLRRIRDFSLEEQCEQIVNLKDANGSRALLTLYSMLTNRLKFTVDVDGESRELTRDALMSRVLSSSAEAREGAYREFFRVYEDEATVLGQIYVHRVRDWHNEHVELRGYESPIDVRNVSNDIPGVAVERLLEVARRNAGLFHRFFRLKAGWLGTDKLRRFDLYAPLDCGRDQGLVYNQAVETVLDTFAKFDSSFATAAARVFLDDHVDSEIRAGKKSGAFCATVLPRMSPWVLLNYDGKLRDVATLAHELGHAVHSVMAQEHSVLTQHASLPLAETASVFAEMLLTERLLAQESDVSARRELLASALDDIYATVLRQSFFVLFEIEAHRAINEGCSLDDLHRIYSENLERQFGDAVELTPEFRYEWVSIPHIYATPFYCYAYSFGQLLVLALYRRYRLDPEGFKPGYLRLLAHGGSARPEEILTEAGVDVADEAFWQGGFDLVAELVDQLEALE